MLSLSPLHAACDLWPCWMPSGPGLPHLSSWCGWQSVYPAGTLRPYFRPLTCADEKLDRLFLLSCQACWQTVRPTAVYKYTLVGKYTKMPACLHQYWHVHYKIHTQTSRHLDMSQLELSVCTNAMAPAIWPVTNCSSLEPQSINPLGLNVTHYQIMGKWPMICHIWAIQMAE